MLGDELFLGSQGGLLGTSALRSLAGQMEGFDFEKPFLAVPL